jgi:uncharacterized protein
MSFTDRINNDLKEAMKAQDQKSLRAIRAIKAAILLANTDGTGQELTDDRALAIVQKLMKQRKESHDIYLSQGREDLAVIEKEEMDVLVRYLPAQLDDESVKNILRQIIQETGAAGPKDMGKVMGVATKKLAGQADGKLVSSLVKELLGS